MLAVSVDLGDVVVAALKPQLESRLDGAADSEVERQSDQRGACRRGLVGGVVGRAIIHHDDIETWRGVAQRSHYAADRIDLVVRGHNRQKRAVIKRHQTGPLWRRNGRSADPEPQTQS